MIASALRILAPLLVAAALLDPEAAQAEMRVLDAAGHEVAIGSAERIVSVGGAITEILYALGLEERIVAVDTTSLYPQQVAEKPDVGYMRQLAAEPILALEPTLVLVEEDSGPPAVLDQLREAGVPVVAVADDYSAEGVLEKIGRIAAAVGEEARGEALIARVRDEIESVRASLGEVAARPRVLFLLSLGKGAPLAAGRRTSADGIIALAGGRNAIDGFERYKPLSPEAAVAAAPDVIVVTSRSLALLGGNEGVLAMPEVALTPAGEHGRVIAIDGLLLLGFGPRIATAIRMLAQALHPELSL
ncbi:MAG: heme/hemin ABC transporter substrate-binding protein [Kiloniellales bacterium]